MSRMEPILKASLLGTDKWMPPLDDLPESIGARIQENAADREDAFLKYAGLLLIAHEAGALTAEVSQPIDTCAADTLPEITGEKAALLRECLKENDELLTGYFAAYCRHAGWIAPGDTIPALLDMAVKIKKLRKELLACTGATGKWLTSFNPYWQELVFSKPGDPDEETWETGHEAERVQFVETLRKKDPARAVALLEKAMPEENAAARLAFLQTLHTGKSLADEAFLTSLLNDKSKQVKAEALYLLKTIPGTRLNQKFLDYCKAVCSIREERYLLLAKRKVLHIAENMEPSKELFEAGINKVSSLKGMADHLSWFAECLSFTHPDLLASALGTTADILFDLLYGNKELEPLRIHISMAAVNFRHTEWVRKLIGQGVSVNGTLLNVLPFGEAVQHLPRLLQTDAGSVLQMLESQAYTELPNETARDVFFYLKDNPYTIPKTDYRKLALYFPVSSLRFIREWINAGAIPNQNPFFINQCMEMEKIVAAKKIFTS